MAPVYVYVWQPDKRHSCCSTTSPHPSNCGADGTPRIQCIYTHNHSQPHRSTQTETTQDQRSTRANTSCTNTLVLLPSLADQYESNLAQNTYIDMLYIPPRSGHRYPICSIASLWTITHLHKQVCLWSGLDSLLPPVVKPHLSSIHTSPGLYPLQYPTQAYGLISHSPLVWPDQ